MPKEPEEESKPTYESLESVSVSFFSLLTNVTCLNAPQLLYITQIFVSFQDNQRLQKANETLRRKLREAEREVEILKTLLKRHALHPVEEDSSS